MKLRSLTKTNVTINVLDMLKRNTSQKLEGKCANGNGNAGGGNSHKYNRLFQLCYSSLHICITQTHRSPHTDVMLAPDQNVVCTLDSNQSRL